MKISEYVIEFYACSHQWRWWRRQKRRQQSSNTAKKIRQFFHYKKIELFQLTGNTLKKTLLFVVACAYTQTAKLIITGCLEKIWPMLWAHKKRTITTTKKDEKNTRESKKKKTRKRFVAADAWFKLNKVIKAPSTWSSPKATTTQNAHRFPNTHRIEN